MRFSEKKQILEGLCKLKEHYHTELLTPNRDTLEILMDCQTLAIRLGEKIEASVPDCDNMIHKLEEYCEEIYGCAKWQGSLEEKVEILNQKMEWVKEEIEKIRGTYVMLFLPYKASMWDSLESIWLAAREEELFECIVMPTPYYCYDAEHKSLIDCYEGNQFPAYVPITDYREIELEKLRPDVIFIHNPYDDSNFVTSVPERYFSRELKKYCELLLYVPYYVTKGTISKAQSDVPVYRNMDYMIAQSKYFKEGTDKLYFADKVVALGSPKFDRVINLGKKTEKTNDKIKKVMLNTSLNCFLQDADAYLRKLEVIFKLVSKRKDIVLVWRPHPLLESTIRSLRSGLWETYQNLKQNFMEQEIGILDDTADITETVVNCDAYIGEAESSVVNLFAVAGKPVFILDNYRYRAETVEEQCRFYIQDMVQAGDTTWMISDTNRLFYHKKDSNEICCAGEIPEQPKWNKPNVKIAYRGNKIYFAPMNAGYPAVFDVTEQKFERVNGKVMDTGFRCRAVILYKDKIFYLPHYGNSIYEYDTKAGEWREYTDGIRKLHACAKGKFYESVYAWKQEQNFLWMTATDTNCILRFDMERGESSVFALGDEEMAYSGIELDGEKIWLAEVHTGDLVLWDRASGSYQRFAMLAEFNPCASSGKRRLAHKQIYRVGEWIVTIPGYSNTMVKCQKDTHQMQLFGTNFFSKETDSEVAGYSAKISENEFAVQRNSDGVFAIVEVESESLRLYEPRISEKTLREMLADENGFEKIHRNTEYSCRESRYFSLEGFLEHLAENKYTNIADMRKMQSKDLAENADGTCGEKVVAFVKKKLEESEG